MSSRDLPSIPLSIKSMMGERDTETDTETDTESESARDECERVCVCVLLCVREREGAVRLESTVADIHMHICT
jgi:hypothetical protein